jgi:hypothetical protein
MDSKLIRRWRKSVFLECTVYLLSNADMISGLLSLDLRAT